jgi:hypothetical protein
MPQGGRGKARKISDDMIIDSDNAAAVMVTDALDNLDGELSDNSLPAKVSIDKLPDSPSHRGVKRKISAIIPSKQIPGELKHLYHLKVESIENASSIGLRSGEYGGRNSSRTP